MLRNLICPSSFATQQGKAEARTDTFRLQAGVQALKQITIKIASTTRGPIVRLISTMRCLDSPCRSSKDAKYSVSGVRSDDITTA